LVAPNKRRRANVVTDVDDLVAAHRDRLRPGIRFVDGVDLAVCENEVG